MTPSGTPQEKGKTQENHPHLLSESFLDVRPRLKIAYQLDIHMEVISNVLRVLYVHYVFDSLCVCVFPMSLPPPVCVCVPYVFDSLCVCVCVPYVFDSLCVCVFTMSLTPPVCVCSLCLIF